VPRPGTAPTIAHRARRWSVAGVNAGRASVGYLAFRGRGKQPAFGVMGLRGLFTADPMLPKRISRITTLGRPPRPVVPARGVLGSLDHREIERASEAVRRDGFFVFPRRLDPTLVESLHSTAAALPRYASLPGDAGQIEFDPEHIVSSRYVCKQEELVNAGVVQQLLADRSFLAVADTYLHCDAVQTDIGAWQSVVFGPETRSASSQLFHSDRDHLQFLKFFVYLTDVTANTGPHVFVRGSHRTRPELLRRDIRFSDDDVFEYFARDDVVELLGPSGTIIAADTSGLHRGKPPDAGERWIFELEFASSLFGPGGLPLDVRVVSPELAEQLRSTPRKYARFRVLD
jgi:Phytanoyl-CoA dioxygenase (PhyH)